VSLHFRSICSSSSGNCLALWSQNTRLLIDCGLSSMKRTRQVLSSFFGNYSQEDSVLLTHNHSDHISYYPLRVLEELGLTVRIHEDCIEQLIRKHANGYGFKKLNIKSFKDWKFTVGEFSVKPFNVSHSPYYPTYGFEIYWEDKKIVIATDFNEWDSVFESFLNADFIFVESNHNMELLKRFYNPNSQFHMPNPQTGNLLLKAACEGRKCPSVVMLGHISSQRNEPDLAFQETVNVFEEAGKKIDFELLTAPLKQCSEVIEIS
jgi:phosphoribosyl 1,2-cyclic phosphodiesterase